MMQHLLCSILQLDNYEIRKGKNLKCNISVANLRLFVGNIPKSKSKEEIMEEFSKITGTYILHLFRHGMFKDQCSAISDPTDAHLSIWRNA